MSAEKKETEWNSLKKKIKTKFGKLNESEIDGLKGHMDQLSSKVQKAYGYDKEKAEKECKEFNDAHESRKFG